MGLSLSWADVSPNPLGTSATLGLIVIAANDDDVIVRVEQLVEWELRLETEVRRENLHPEPLCPPQISHILTCLGSSTGRRVGKYAANRPSYDRADLSDKSRLSERLSGNRMHRSQELLVALLT
jgi:hypothetical protein